jgi:hypothetical protein
MDMEFLFAGILIAAYLVFNVIASWAETLWRKRHSA